jgi:hypothetical protein
MMFVAKSPQEFSRLCGMSEPRISYKGYPDTSSEAEISALANIYRLILHSAKQRDRLPDKSGPEHARKDQDARTHSHCT